MLSSDLSPIIHFLFRLKPCAYSYPAIEMLIHDIVHIPIKYIEIPISRPPLTQVAISVHGIDCAKALKQRHT